MASGEIGVVINKDKLVDLIRTSPTKASNLVDAMALDGQAYAVRSFTVSVSAPGEPPGVVTGALRASIHVEEINPYKRSIVVGMEYGIHLEFGTEKMAARPFMGPMANYIQRHVMDYWRTFVE